MTGLFSPPLAFLSLVLSFSSRLLSEKLLMRSGASARPAGAAAGLAGGPLRLTAAPNLKDVMKTNAADFVRDVMGINGLRTQQVASRFEGIGCHTTEDFARFTEVRSVAVRVCHSTQPIMRRGTHATVEHTHAPISYRAPWRSRLLSSWLRLLV